MRRSRSCRCLTRRSWTESFHEGTVLRIKWNNRFQEFDPLLLPQHILTEADIAATFGDFLDGVFRLLEDEVP